MEGRGWGEGEAGLAAQEELEGEDRGEEVGEEGEGHGGRGRGRVVVWRFGDWWMVFVKC